MRPYTYSMRVLVVLVAIATCAPLVGSTIQGPVGPAPIAELWVEPADIGRRDLFNGPGGAELTPAPGASYEFVAKDTTGYSRGWDVKDSKGLVWSVKYGLEAQTEVVMSRILWAIGYHEPPTYYVRSWTLVGGDAPGPKLPSRFRPELPRHKKVGMWAWEQNPFVGTRPFRGLIVLNVLLNNWDFKTTNNSIFELEQESQGAKRWYIVKDLGASLGRTRPIIIGTRNDIEGYERQGLIKGVSNGRVQFDYLGKRRDLLRNITPADVRWVCSLLAQVTPQQWRDAFRAGGYASEVSERYVKKIQEKIQQGLKLPEEP